MDGDSWIQIILLILLLGGAAYCAASEIAFASVNKIRLRNLAEGDDKRAEKALYVTDNFDKAISTILIGNNITHIGFAAIATLISIRYWGVESVKYSTVAATIVVFLFSEMIPKSYGKANSIKFALLAAGSLSIMIKLFSPITYVFTLLSTSLSKLLPVVEEDSITEEEFYDIIETANEEGILDRNSQELIESALWFDDMTVGDIYTAIEDVIAVDIELTEEEILDVVKRHKYSRIPIYRSNINQIVGILSARKLIKQYIKHSTINIDSLILDPYFVKSGIPIDTLLKQMSLKKLHLAIVVDDSLNTIGIVTIEDILEELVGEIWDEDDIVNEDFAKLGGERYEINGNLMICNVFEEMGYDVGTDLESTRNKTVSEWVAEKLDKPPKQGDKIVVKDIEITFTQITNNKISRVIIKML
jgi:CBS domain containing-hemolysin-like protein